MNSSFSNMPTGLYSVKLGLVAVAVIVLTSCAQFHPPGDPDARATTPLNPPGTPSKGKLPAKLAGDLPGPGKTDHTGAIRHDVDSPRIAQLWAAAEKARLADNLEQAESYIQEALVIAPEDSVLWSRAAELKLTMLEPALAENYAGKSIAYAADNGTLLHRNWLIIEHARDLRGDLLGVRDAHKMVQRFQY